MAQTKVAIDKVLVLPAGTMAEATKRCAQRKSGVSTARVVGQGR